MSNPISGNEQGAVPAIVTVTVNPALDTSSHVASVAPDHKLRCSVPIYEPGGGGINVARAIHQLGGKTMALWTCGGAIGHFLGNLIKQSKVTNRPVLIEGMTRENLVVTDESNGRQYRFCHPGPTLSTFEEAKLIDLVKNLDPAPAYLVISGGPSPGLSADFYTRLINATSDDCRVILDTSGLAISSFDKRPMYLYKSNIGELGLFLGRTLQSDADVVESARSLIVAGVTEYVVTSLGAGGALLVSENKVIQIKAPTVPIVSRVGAGDSMTAGMVLALSRKESIDDAFMWGVAAGTAAVMTPGTQLCHRSQTEELFARLRQPIEER